MIILDVCVCVCLCVCVRERKGWGKDYYQFVDLIVTQIESLEFLELRQRLRQTSNQILAKLQRRQIRQTENQKLNSNAKSSFRVKDKRTVGLPIWAIHFRIFLVKNSKHILKEILLIHGRETLIYD